MKFVSMLDRLCGLAAALLLRGDALQTCLSGTVPPFTLPAQKAVLPLCVVTAPCRDRGTKDTAGLQTPALPGHQQS